MNPSWPVLTRDQVRQVDRAAIEDLGMSGLVLMENAGRGVSDLLLRLGAPGRVLILCGRGNNAGDGFVIARHLDLQGIPVEVELWCGADSLAGDARANYRLLAHTHVKVWEQPEPARTLDCTRDDWLIDALLGTGARGNPRPPVDQAIQAINRSAARCLAIDLPSGLDADTGEAHEPTVTAAHTCTFVAAKPGLLAAGAAAFVGQLHIVDIGVPRRLLQQFGLSLPRLPDDALDRP